MFHATGSGNQNPPPAFRVLALAAFCLMMIGAGSASLAHPGASIRVGQDGRVYFVDTGSGVFVIEPGGRLRRHDGPAFHWFAMDETSRLVKTPWPAISGAEIVAAGRNPTLILSSDFAVAVGSDGAFYYPEPEAETHWRIIRVNPSGSRSLRARFRADRRPDGSLSSVNGLAATADGSLYFTHDRSVKKIDARGVVTAIVNNVSVPKCVRIPGVEAEVGPYLRGLDVAPNGTIFVAAAGCGAVLMISNKGVIKPVLRTRSPYSPTAVAVSKGEIFVLEYLHTASDDRREWLPRIRKVTRAGTVETIATQTR